MSLTYGSRRALLTRDKGGGVPANALVLDNIALLLDGGFLILTGS